MNDMAAPRVGVVIRCDTGADATHSFRPPRFGRIRSSSAWTASRAGSVAARRLRRIAFRSVRFAARSSRSSARSSFASTWTPGIGYSAVSVEVMLTWQTAFTPSSRTSNGTDC